MLIRRAHAMGRRDIGKKVLYTKERGGGAKVARKDPLIWTTFLRTVGIVTGLNWDGDWADHAAAEAALVAHQLPANHRHMEKMIPWLWTEVRRKGDYTLGRAERPDLQEVRDWYGTMRPRDLGKIDFKTALERAKAWHRTLTTQWRETPTLLRFAFPTVIAQVTEGPLRGEWRTGKDKDAAKEVGKILGHCYMHDWAFDTYVRSGDLYVFFDAAGGRPRMSVSIDQSGRSIKDAKQSQNALIREEKWPAVLVLLPRVLPDWNHWGGWKFRHPDWHAHIKTLFAAAALSFEGLLRLGKLGRNEHGLNATDEQARDMYETARVVHAAYVDSRNVRAKFLEQRGLEGRMPTVTMKAGLLHREVVASDWDWKGEWAEARRTAILGLQAWLQKPQATIEAATPKTLPPKLNLPIVLPGLRILDHRSALPSLARAVLDPTEATPEALRAFFTLDLRARERFFQEGTDAWRAAIEPRLGLAASRGRRRRR
jgi:hypothetical protein